MSAEKITAYSQNRSGRGARNAVALARSAIAAMMVTAARVRPARAANEAA